MPSAEKRKDETPIIIIDNHRSMRMKAKETPTANASMLVAKANVRTTLSLNGFKLFSSGCTKKFSQIIRPPKTTRIPKEIQWSNVSIKCWKVLPASQPIKGIKAWNRPKKKATRNAGPHLKGFRAMPQAMETAKQSMANPMAMRMMSERFMDEGFFRFRSVKGSFFCLESLIFVFKIRCMTFELLAR